MQKKILIIGVLILEIILIRYWIYEIIKPDPSIAIGLIIFVTMLLGINLFFAIAVYFIIKPYSKLFLFNAVFCSLIFYLFWNSWYNSYNERNYTYYKFSLNSIVYELNIGKNNEYFYLCDENNNGRVFVGKYEKKGDSILLKDSEYEMYIKSNKLFEFPEMRTGIELTEFIKTE